MSDKVIIEFPEYVRRQAAIFKDIFRGQPIIAVPEGPNESRAFARDELAKVRLTGPIPAFRNESQDEAFERCFNAALLNYKFGDWRNRLPKDETLLKWAQKHTRVL